MIAGGPKSTTYAAPSPFKEPGGASYQMAGFRILKQGDHDSLRLKQTLGWDKTLTAANPDGR